MTTKYIVKYSPLCCNTMGRQAVTAHNLKPFVDGSCRREPDFEHAYPCVTGTCRPGFSHSLKTGDLVVYINNSSGVNTTNLIAIYEVSGKCVSHEEAAHWYHKQHPNYSLPNNLLVSGNPHKSIEYTHGKGPKECGNPKNERYARCWNKAYEDRVKANSKNEVVALLKPWQEHQYINEPIEITPVDFEVIFSVHPSRATWTKQRKFKKKSEHNEWATFVEWLEFKRCK